MNNVLKHSRATEMALSARKDGLKVEICLQDNGAGFDLAAVQTRSECNGLQNMQQRMNALGGWFVIETRPGNGSIIKLTIDYPQGQVPGEKSTA
ncbi:MAG: hypothetical protein WCL11_21705, partial [Verrucomicrobiota bacterium]